MSCRWWRQRVPLFHASVCERWSGIGCWVWGHRSTAWRHHHPGSLPAFGHLRRNKITGCRTSWWRPKDILVGHYRIPSIQVKSLIITFISLYPTAVYEQSGKFMLKWSQKLHHNTINSVRTLQLYDNTWFMVQSPAKALTLWARKYGLIYFALCVKAKR